MATVPDVVGSETQSAFAGSPHTYTGLTTSATLSNGAVTFIVCYDTHVTGSAATWDGIPCFLIAGVNTTGASGRVEIWGLSPIGGHTGNKTFVVSWTGGGSAQTDICGVSWSGVDQTGGLTSFPGGNTNQGSITTTGTASVGIAPGQFISGSAWTYSNNNHTVTAGAINLNDLRAQPAVWGAKYHLQITYVATGDANDHLGIANPSTATFLVYNLSNGGVFTSVGGQVATIQTSAAGSVIDLEVDTINQKIWIRTNGGNWNNAAIGSQNPATNTGGISFSSEGFSATNPIFPDVFSSAVGTSFTIDTGDSPFAFAVSAGFVAWFSSDGGSAIAGHSTDTGGFIASVSNTQIYIDNTNSAAGFFSGANYGTGAVTLSAALTSGPATWASAGGSIKAAATLAFLAGSWAAIPVRYSVIGAG